MAYRKTPDMRYPVRAAPPPPKKAPPTVDSWGDDLFANDPFTNNVPNQKKKPPPRPPPPKFNKAPPSKPDIPQRPSHFNRKPTILSSLMSRKSKPAVPPTTSSSDFQSHVILPPPSKSNSSNPVSSLIDFSSPPSSPTLTTRSSSDGLSVDSFGSDITSSTGNGNQNTNGGNMSQAESGFEDDFDLFSNTKTDTEVDSWAGFDPFSPPKNALKPTVKKPVYESDFLDPLCNGKTVVSKVQTHNLPTIIRAKPARPKAPKNSTLLTSTLNEVGLKPAINNYSPNIETSLLAEDKYYATSESLFNDGDYSPPMPSVPPPPPPAAAEDVDITDDPALQSSSREWSPNDYSESSEEPGLEYQDPYGIALFDFPGTEPDDLPFKVNDKIRLIKHMNESWMLGRTRSGMEGMFPANYIEVIVPIGAPPVPKPPPQVRRHSVVAMYDFTPQMEGDLGLTVGCLVHVLGKVNDEWLYGEVDGVKGQFPLTYVDHVPAGLSDIQL